MGAPGDRERWNRRYAAEGDAHGDTAPVAFLEKVVDLLPRGRALDLAMGAGRNAVFLAHHGYDVTGLDISEEALVRVAALAARRGVSIHTETVNLEDHELPPETYDVVVCTYYLQRNLFPRIRRTLTRGGMAVVETYTLDHVKHRPGFRREYLLEPNELRKLFAGFRVLRCQEVDDGSAAYASMLVQKP